MSNDEIMGANKKSVLKLNKLLEFGLGESSLFKTGRARNHKHIGSRKTPWIEKKLNGMKVILVSIIVKQHLMTEQSNLSFL
jgi:hypothetical protein